MTAETIIIRLQPHQKNFFHAVKSLKFSEVAMFGGVGAGKSFTLAHIWLWLHENYPGVPGLFIGQTNTTIGASLEQVAKEWDRLGVKYWRTESKIQTESGPRLHLEANGIHAAHYIRSLHGGDVTMTAFEVGYVIADEFVDGDKEAFDLIHGRLRDGRGPLICVYTSNPPRVKSWGIDYFGKEKPGMKVFTGVSTFDNRHTPVKYKEKLKGQYSGDMAARELGGKLIRLTGSVWPVKTISYQFQKGKPYYISIDFGFRRSAAGFFQEKSPGVWVLFDALLLSDMGTEKLSEKIKERMKERHGTDVMPQYITCDPAGDSDDSRMHISDVEILERSFSYESSREFGKTVSSVHVNYINAHAWRQISRGITVVHNRFTNGTFYIADNLSEKEEGQYISLLDAVLRLSYAPEEGGKLSDAYRKDGISDHAGDMIRYFFMWLEWISGGHGKMVVL